MGDPQRSPRGIQKARHMIVKERLFILDSLQAISVSWKEDLSIATSVSLHDIGKLVPELWRRTCMGVTRMPFRIK